MAEPVPAAEQRDPRLDEHDACALIANVRKKGGASHGNVKRTIEALMMMAHRSGIVDGEGDVGMGPLSPGMHARIRAPGALDPDW